MNLKIWHIPQIPGKAFSVPVKSPEEGADILAILQAYDQFQFQHNVKPDFSNASGMHDDNGEEWYNEDGDCIQGSDEVWEELVELNSIRF